MKWSIPLFAAAAAAAFATPAAADSMTCGRFMALDGGQQLEAVDAIEPKSIEDSTSVEKGVSEAKASSGADGTVDPAMLEGDKVKAILAACDGNVGMDVADAAAMAFKK